MVKYQFVFLFFLSVAAFSQFNFFEFDYRLAPIANDNVDNYITSFKLNTPVKMKKGVLMNSVSFDKYQFSYSAINFDTKDLKELYKINYTAAYIYPLTKKWRLRSFVGASLASNLTETLTTDDFLINGGLIGIKDLSKGELKSMLSFGLTYSSLAGSPRVIPVFRYFKQLNNKLSYSLGFPTTNVSYKVDETNLVKAYLGIKNVYANLGDAIAITNTQKADKAFFVTGDLGLIYEHKLDDMWTMTGKAGYSIYSNYELLDETNNQVYDFDLEPAPFFSLGLKLNLNKQ